jgi:hypothetical protein
MHQANCLNEQNEKFILLHTKHRKVIIMLRIFALLLIISSILKAQLDCDVTINIQSIPAATERLQNFERDIENYMNSNKWSTEDLGGERIKCSMNIFFASMSGENNYQTQVFIGSRRPVYQGNNKTDKNTITLRVFDDKWEFTYDKSQSLYRNETQFDALTDFLDFYAYLIVGFDFDSYSKQGGTPYFQKAMALVNQASTGSKGWDRATGTTYSRYGLAEEVNNPNNQPFREGWYLYHYKGLDWLATKPESAYKNMIKLIDNIANLKKTSPRGLLFRNFFETKYEELADVFKGYNDKSVYQLLVSVDQAHQNAYDQAVKGK